ncbi:MAG: flagellar basal body-associated FliL family protein [Candidatus Nitrotoga sp.]|nr:flagellar basal body-associated FliL family protein [Candidatus Nitrotoga sp.]MDO9448721.1 flagellar basal body-associated FliL family protein [Candidatus Nitrotoga sp.]RFC41233.1 MAG: flagellar FliL protein [Candidatus Nitrotoga sp. CP45]
MAKPTPKKDAADSAPAGATAKPNGKKKLLIIIGSVLALGIAGGAGWYFTKGGDHNDKNAKKASQHVEQPKFIALEPFTVNLQRESADQFLQIGITLKIFQPELEEKIKQNLPEIRSRLLVLLSGKYASELVASKGKTKLVKEIISETETVLGLRTTRAPRPKPIAPPPAEAASSVEGANREESPAATEVAEGAEGAAAVKEAVPAIPSNEANENVIDVLFTSFIIQ